MKEWRHLLLLTAFFLASVVIVVMVGPRRANLQHPMVVKVRFMRVMFSTGMPRQVVSMKLRRVHG